MGADGNRRLAERRGQTGRCGPGSGWSGFTLVEVLVVAAVIVILLAVAVPSWRRINDRQAEAQAINALVSTLGLVRAEAMQTGVETILAVEPVGGNCQGRLGVYRHAWTEEGGSWTATEYSYARTEESELPDGLAVAPIDEDDAVQNFMVDAGGAWTAFCFEGSGRIVARDGVQLTHDELCQEPGGETGLKTSLGFKVYRPAVLLQHVGKSRLSDVTAEEFRSFLSATSPPGLWRAVVLNQWTGRPLEVK